jgi:hypothetical protein
MIIRDNATAEEGGVVGASDEHQHERPPCSIVSFLIYHGRPRDPPRQFDQSALIAMSDGSHVNKGDFATNPNLKNRGSDCGPLFDDRDAGEWNT